MPFKCSHSLNFDRDDNFAVQIGYTNFQEQYREGHLPTSSPIQWVISFLSSPSLQVTHPCYHLSVTLACSLVVWSEVGFPLLPRRNFHREALGGCHCCPPISQVRKLRPLEAKPCGWCIHRLWLEAQLPPEPGRPREMTLLGSGQLVFGVGWKGAHPGCHGNPQAPAH